jgi:DNA-binding PadR family transcriptional regulator
MKLRNVVKQFSWNRKNHIMNDSLIKDYLTFFKNEKVDLRNEGINEKIDFYFERTSFLNNIEILENNSLIIETEHGNCTYLITEKGEKYLKQITEKLDYEAEKERIEFEKSKTDLVLAQKMLKEFPKTKMFSRISLFIAIVLALKELYILIKPIL